MSNRAVKTAKVSMRILHPFREAMKSWAVRAEKTFTEFVMIVVPYGARRMAKILGVNETKDDQQVEIMGEIMWVKIINSVEPTMDITDWL